MNFNIINIVIVVFVAYFAYTGFKHGFIKELSSIISYITGFLLSKILGPILEQYLMLEIFIKDDALRQKIGYLISFIIIVYIFKIISGLIEKFIDMKWQNKFLGLIIGILNGILIFSLIISIFKELLPSMNIHEDWRNKSYLYRNIDMLQKQYIIQYNQLQNK
tara:strand:+ start:3174 stop:3662 length:489 start_codon:yes stop_codon:yes gene_type:complete